MSSYSDEPEFSILIIGDSDNAEHIENGLNYLLEEYSIFKYVTFTLSKESPNYFNEVVENILNSYSLIYSYIDGLKVLDNKVYIKNRDVCIDSLFNVVIYFNELKNTKLIHVLNNHYSKIEKKFNLYVC